MYYIETSALSVKIICSPQNNVAGRTRYCTTRNISCNIQFSSTFLCYISEILKTFWTVWGRGGERMLQLFSGLGVGSLGAFQGGGGGGGGNLTNVIYEFFLGVVGKKDLLKLKNSHIALKRGHREVYLLTYSVPY